MHLDNPAALVEQSFARIHHERMVGLDLLNPALSVATVGFARHGNDWRGVLVTPWGIHLLLLPAVADWPVPPPHERAFRHYPAGDFAFLNNHEQGLGVYLVCPLVHDMRPYADQATVLLTAQACLLALDTAPAVTPAEPATAATAAAPGSSSRRRFLMLGS